MSQSSIAPIIPGAPDRVSATPGEPTLDGPAQDNPVFAPASSFEPPRSSLASDARGVAIINSAGQPFDSAETTAVSSPLESSAPKPAAATAASDLSRPELYLNRELTWLAFNWRVLAEAADPRNPLLERVKFLAITASNQDEFFMKRIGGLKQQVVAGMLEMTPDGRSPRQQITECYADVRRMEQRQREILNELLSALKQFDIRLVTYDELTDEQRAEVSQHYLRNIFPLVTPLAMDPAHPFPFVSNLSNNLLVTVRDSQGGEQLIARIKVPLGAGIPRFIRAGSSLHFVPLEDVIAHNLELLFPNMQV